jgi:predicted HAD superfamily Cof-like phosphohydrolase
VKLIFLPSDFYFICYFKVEESSHCVYAGSDGEAGLIFLPSDFYFICYFKVEESNRCVYAGSDGEAGLSICE